MPQNYGMPNGVIETKYGKMRWHLSAGDAVVLDNDPADTSFGTDYLTGAYGERPAFDGSKATIRGVAYSARITLRLNGGQWEVTDCYLTRKERLPIGKDAKELIGKAALKAWQAFIALNPALPHLAQRYYLANKVNSAKAEALKLSAALRKAEQEVASLEQQFEDAQANVLATVNEVQKEKLDTGFLR
jgi:hypothetical protein